MMGAGIKKRCRKRMRARSSAEMSRAMEMMPMW